MAKESSRKDTSIITGIVCPNCGRDRARRTGPRDQGELRCTFCGHAWTPRPSTD